MYNSPKNISTPLKKFQRLPKNLNPSLKIFKPIQMNLSSLIYVNRTTSPPPPPTKNISTTLKTISIISEKKINPFRKISGLPKKFQPSQNILTPLIHVNMYLPPPHILFYFFYLFLSTSFPSLLKNNCFLIAGGLNYLSSPPPPPLISPRTIHCLLFIRLFFFCAC